MKKILIIILFMIDFSYSQSIDILQLQQQFNKKVHDLNIFRKRYNNYLEKHCDDALPCFEQTMSKLTTWKSVQQDKKLAYYYNKYSDLYHNDSTYFSKLVKKITLKNLPLAQTQFVSIVDLDQQLFTLLLWDDDNKQFHFIGKDYVSTGNIRREYEIKHGDNHYFKTPTGIFKIQSGWRSDGKYNEDNKTFGYGYKDRYVFYFGKQKSIRYNIFDTNGTKVDDVDDKKLITDTLDFALHAHKSAKPMGEPYSHGCVRTTDELNRFLDNNFVLHKIFLQDKKWLNKNTTPPKVPQNEDLAGQFLIIFNKI